MRHWLIILALCCVLWTPAWATDAVLAVLVDPSTAMTQEVAQGHAETMAAWLNDVSWGQLALTGVAFTGAPVGDCSMAVAAARADAFLGAQGLTPYRTMIVMDRSSCTYPAVSEPYGTHVAVAGLPDTHELGHTYLFQHNTGGIDPMDGMSNVLTHWNAPHKGMMDWHLETGAFAPGPGQVSCFWDDGAGGHCDYVPSWSVDGVAGGTYSIASLDTPSSLDTPAAVRIPFEWDAAGHPVRFVYLEHRRDVGFDQHWLAWLPRFPLPAVLVHSGRPYNYFNAPWPTVYKGHIAPGETMLDCLAHLAITVESIGEMARVAVQAYDAPCALPVPPSPPCHGRKCK